MNVFGVGLLALYLGLASAGRSCPVWDIVFLIDRSENAHQLSNDPRQGSDFGAIQGALRNFFQNRQVYDSPMMFSAYGYSGEEMPTTIIRPGSSAREAVGQVINIREGARSGSWTYKGLSAITRAPNATKSLIVVVSSQGSGETLRRQYAQEQRNRLTRMLWEIQAYGVKGGNVLDYQELRAVSGENELVVAESYSDLSNRLQSLISTKLCPTPKAICDSCKIKGGFFYAPDAEFCDRFLMCENSQEPRFKYCPEGTFWRESTGCDHIYKVQCPHAPCSPDGRHDGVSYPSALCCNSFFTCQKGHLISNKCPGTFHFDMASRRCMPGRYDESVCQERALCGATHRQTVMGPTGNCRAYQADPTGDPCFFMAGGFKMPVAPGTIFDKLKCFPVMDDNEICTRGMNSDRDLDLNEEPSERCDAVFKTMFNTDVGVMSERRSSPLNVYVEKNEVEMGNSMAVFPRESTNPSIYFFYFNNKEIVCGTAFKIQFRLTSPQVGQVYQLMSNNYCQYCPETMGITVRVTSASSVNVTATFKKAGLGFDTVQTSAELNSMRLSNLLEAVVVWGCDGVYGKLKDLTNSRVAEFKPMPNLNKDPILLNQCGLLLGYGPWGKFVGEIREFAVHDNCVNIRKVLE